MTKDNSSSGTTANIKTRNGNIPDLSPVNLSTTLATADRFGNIFCRISDSFRMKYRVTPGLYAVGNPNPDSPVLVSCNYRLSLNSLRAVLVKKNIWILVIDTKGINVWCAAGKGTFCSDEIARKIAACDLNSKVSHRTLILPQLGASGVSAAKLRNLTGFNVKYGPVRASDIPSYLDNNYTVAPQMRQMKFSLGDRAVLIPMEIIPALKKIGLFLILAAILLGATNSGIIYKKAFSGIAPLVIAALTAVFFGSVLVPLLLPFIPGRAFSIKGFVAGCTGVVVLFLLQPEYLQSVLLTIFCIITVPAFSSYTAFLFTGSSTYTSPSGVKAELKFALPLYLVSAGISVVLFMMMLVKNWRLG